MFAQRSLDSHVLVWLTICTLVCAPFLVIPRVSALQLQNRSLRIGSPNASVATTHGFAFDYPTTGTVGSVSFEYCTSPLPTQSCVGPAGLDASGAVLQSQSGETGFSIVSTTGNVIIIGRTPSASSLVSGNYTFSGVVNPSFIGSFFTRISTYASNNGTGPKTNEGSVVSSTAQGIGISTEVPPILIFCAAVTIPALCDSASGSFIDLGELKKTTTATGTSQMMGGTNADFGYVISANGTTMTSGNNIIAAMNAQGPDQAGTAQFGINLRANTAPAVGANPNGSGIAAPTSGYNTPNQFKFVNGDVIAASPDVTDYVKLTVSYIVNIPSGQPPGFYSTTITYVCAATF
jgi:hypothetical protein